MAARVYATLAQLINYAAESTTLPTEPEATRILTSASKTIERATKSAIYATDGNGYPTDAAVRQAFADATCAQVEWWLETGDETGSAGQYQNVSIGSVSLARGSGAVPGQQLAPKAATELDGAGVLPGSVVQIQTWEGAII